MDLDDLARRFPCLWHVTFAGGWAGIERHGLLRACDLAPAGTLGQRRAEPMLVDGPGGTPVWLRDQLKSRNDPTPCLEDVTPEEWWQLLNQRVYLFCRRPPMERLVESYVAKRGLAQEVLELDTRTVLAPVVAHVELTTVNAGVFPRRSGPSRGRDTFRPLSSFPPEEGAKIVEITVAAAVPVHDEAVTSVVRVDPDGRRTTLHP